MATSYLCSNSMQSSECYRLRRPTRTENPKKESSTAVPLIIFRVTPTEWKLRGRISGPQNGRGSPLPSRDAPLALLTDWPTRALASFALHRVHETEYRSTSVHRMQPLVLRTVATDTTCTTCSDCLVSNDKAPFKKCQAGFSMWPRCPDAWQQHSSLKRLLMAASGKITVSNFKCHAHAKGLQIGQVGNKTIVSQCKNVWTSVDDPKAVVLN